MNSGGTSSNELKEWFIDFDSETVPYQIPIESIKQIENISVPTDKLVLIANLSRGIIDSVNEFWARTNPNVDSSLLNINADELVTIFIYIVIKSQKADLLIDLLFIKEFTTTLFRASMLGYYYTTLECAILYIQKMNKGHNLSI